MDAKVEITSGVMWISHCYRPFSFLLSFPSISKLFSRFLWPVYLVTALMITLLPSSTRSQSINVTDCVDRCDLERPRGHVDPYLFQCGLLKGVIENSPENQKCRTTCNFCNFEYYPKFHCTDFFYNTFHCPMSEIDSRCLDFCQNYPRNGKAVIDCKNESAGSSRLCDICNLYNCPDWFCKHDNLEQVYFCPIDNRTRKPGDLCKKNCELMRYDTKTKDWEDLKFNCDDFTHPESAYCVEDCQTDCLPEICNPDFDPKVYTCPAFATAPPPPPPPGTGADDTTTAAATTTTTPTPAKRRRCSDHCNKFKSSGKRKLELHCTIFSGEEKQACEADCSLCPKDVCNPEGAKIVYHCSALDMPEKKASAPFIILTVTVVFLVILTMAAGGVVMYARRRAAKERRKIAAEADAEENAALEGQELVNYKMMKYSKAVKEPTTSRDVEPTVSLFSLVESREDLGDLADSDTASEVRSSSTRKTNRRKKRKE